MRGQRGSVAFFFRRADAFFVSLALLLLFSCGLPTSDYLYPPADFLNSGNLVQLIHDTRNIDEVGELFKGYDIYYRIFDTYNDAFNSYNSLNNNLTSGNITSIASSQGYYVLVKYQDSNLDTAAVPLIPVSDDNTHNSFYLNLYSNETWTITADYNNEILYYIYRRNKSDIGKVDFCSKSQYLNGDPDYAGSGISEGDSSVYIVFFAVAHGISSSSIGSELYSDPIVLRPITYTPGS